MLAFRSHLSTILVAMITAALTASAPAIAHGVKHALFAHDAGKVDGLNAVTSDTGANKRKGKLVATDADTGQLPNNIMAKALDADKLDGQDSDAFAASAHDHDAAYINASPQDPENAFISIDGELETTGLLNIGSGSGTTGGLGPAMVVRSAHSIDPTEGNVLANAYSLRLERDGTEGGLRFAWDEGAPFTQSGSCLGLTSAGTPVGFYSSELGGDSVGNEQIFTDAQDIVQVECGFGHPMVNGFHTHVSLYRSAASDVWVGFLRSTNNQ